MRLKVFLHYLIGPVGASMFGFMLVPFLAWLYPTEVIGKYSLLQAALVLYVLFFSFGMDHAYVRYFHGDKNKGRLFSSVFKPVLIISVILLLFLLGINFNFVTLYIFSESNFWISVCLFSAFLISICQRFLPLVLRMHEEALKYSIIEVLQKFSFFVCVCIFTLILDWQRDLKLLIYSFIMSGVFVITLNYYFIRKMVVNSVRNCEVKKINENIVEHLKYGIPMAITGIVSWFMIYSERFFIKEYLDYKALGIYTVGLSISGVVSIFTAVFNVMWAPKIFSWASSNSDNEKIKTATWFVSNIAVFCLILVGAFSWVITLILPDEYQSLAYVITGCVSVHIFYVLGEASGIGINIVKKTSFVTIAIAFSCVINIALCSYLIPKFGMSGAAIASSISSYLFYIIRAEISRRIWSSCNERTLYIWPSICLCAIVYHALYGHIGNMWFISGWIFLACIFSFSMTRRFGKLKNDLMSLLK